ncbi:hypothetical protein GCM10023216_12840 [Isoptericola chiayiensis]|uniref:Uncharacterized protein n=1 Tax=Isoptericola chiayiensis TaxID=579446 RepID=A0ABP8YAA5_9MICO
MLPGPGGQGAHVREAVGAGAVGGQDVEQRVVRGGRLGSVHAAQCGTAAEPQGCREILKADFSASTISLRIPAGAPGSAQMCARGTQYSSSEMHGSRPTGARPP